MGERAAAILYSALYPALAGVFLALAVVSRREEVLSYARDPPVLTPIRKMAVFLYKRACEFRKSRRRRGKDLFVPGEERMRSDLAILYPSLKAERQEVQYQIRRIERILMLSLAGIVLAGAVHLRAVCSGILQEDGSVLRAGAGGEDRQLSVTALPDTGIAEKPEKQGEAGSGKKDTADPGEETAEKDAEETAEKTAGAGGEETAEETAEDGYGTYTVTVHARQYTRKEAETRAREILEQLPRSILGENKSAEEIRSPLAMPSAGETEPFVLSWESSRYAVLDSDGSIFNSDYTEKQAEQVELTAILTYGTYRFEKQLSFTVRAPVRDAREKLRGEIEGALLKAESRSASRESFVLPSTVGGRSISWQEEAEDISASVLVMAAVVCLLAWYLMDCRLHERTRERDRQLAIDYPQFISKIVLYMGAGMSVRNVFYKCASQYMEKYADPGEGNPEDPAERPGKLRKGTGKKKRKKREKKRRNVRYIYEEILLVCNELDSGIPEAEAYMHFGRRCHSRQYTKLCTLLIQNLRRGNEELLSILQKEAQNSFEERKNLARELGEEAGTRLLFPMMIMLGITMLIIIVPAYFGFSV